MHPPLRPVRSFVRRQGRMTLAQQRAFATLMDRYGVPAEPETVDLSTLFGRPAPTLLEIGFGTGEALIDFAQRHPHGSVGEGGRYPHRGQDMRRVA